MGKDGTLHRRLRGTRAEGNVFAKTGYIKGVRALSGYLKTDTGEWILFCFLIRNAEAASAPFRESVDDSLLTLLAMK
jgi:D-alanyl-D-alanine carboxypeptidase/D-alanyl-D-alanine-endopeptidase (penicillin-binding protein 4)